VLETTRGLPVPGEGKESMGKTILLADDSITIQKVIELTFSDEDFEVVTVGNGRLAIEKAGEVRPDIVLCDIIMPEKDGYEVCEFIKHHPTLSGVPVLLLTGAFEPFDQERAARVGCDGFLAKPFEPAMLIGKVKDLLAQAASRSGAAAAPATAAMAVAPPPVAEHLPAPEPIFSPPPDIPAHFEAVPVPEGTLPGPASSFITDEPVMDELPDQPLFEPDPQPIEVAGNPEAPSALEEELYGMGDAVEAAPEDFAPVSPEEADTLAGGPEYAAPAEDDVSSTVVFRPTSPLPWEEPAPEAPAEPAPTPPNLELEPTPEPAGFEEVFDGELPASPPAFEATVPPAPEPVAAPPPTPATQAPVSAPAFVPEPEPPAPVAAAVHPLPVQAPAAEASLPEPAPIPQQDLPEEVSFADLAPAAPVHPPAPLSGAAEVAVPVDMVAQIAQRVVAQISERVVREVAWEIIPELAEALIKKEIERLKAELQNT
jgi:CheY-like chemotaxis protein